MASDPVRQGAPLRLPAAIWAIGFVSMFMDISSEMIHALLPAYLTGAMGASLMTVGLIEGIAEATAAVTKLFSGIISDWFGRRKLLASMGYGLAALTKPVFPLAGGVGPIMAARFIDRIGKGIRGAPRDALVSEIAPRELHGSAFGLRQSLDTIGAFVGPLIAIALMAWSADNFKLVFWIAVIPALIAVGLMVFAVREPPRQPAQIAPRFPLSRGAIRALGKPFWMVIFVASLFTLARFSEAFLLLRAQAGGLPLMWLPVVLVLMNVIYALVSWPVGALSDRIGRAAMLAVGMATLICADVALARSETLTGVALGVGLWGLHMGLTQGTLSALVADNSPTELRGTAFGLFNLLTGLALLVASPLAGWLWDGQGPAMTFYAGAGFALLALMALAATGALKRAPARD